MIVSHKHKFIFIKTHKTSTQTFMKFIKPHLGQDDIMAGDPSNDVNDNTKINVDKLLPTGKTALMYQEKYGNHLPWFIIKEIVGDDIWNEYTKFTIEREPQDRLVSLFCFMNPILILPSHFLPSEATRSKLKGPEIKEMLSKSILQLYPNQVRQYFEDTTLLQLLTKKLPLTEHDTYGVPGVEAERLLYRNCAKLHNLDKVFDIDNCPTVFTTKGKQEQIVHPYISDEVWIRAEPYRRYHNIEGQCRFLNYGYYHDGKNQQVDRVIPYAGGVGNNIGKFFNDVNIKIKCNNNMYNNNSQNVHYRKNKNLKPVDWWFEGKKGKRLIKQINKTFNL